MEGGRVRVRAVLVVGLVLGLLLGQSDAFSPICYAGCVGECLVFHGSLMTCAIKCIWKCLFALSDTPPDSHSLCKFNCAAKLCANITTADHLGISLSLSLYLSHSICLCLSLILFLFLFGRSGGSGKLCELLRGKLHPELFIILISS